MACLTSPSSCTFPTPQGKKERIGRLMLMHANNREDIKEAFAGDIVAIGGLKDVVTGAGGAVGWVQLGSATRCSWAGAVSSSLHGTPSRPLSPPLTLTPTPHRPPTTTTPGETLCCEKNPIILEKMDFPDPVIKIAIEPKSKADLEKMGMGLNKLAQV